MADTCTFCRLANVAATVLFSGSLLVQLFTDGWWVWLAYFFTSSVLAASLLYRPDLKQCSRLWRFTNSLMVVSGFFCLLFIYWSTKDYVNYNSANICSSTDAGYCGILSVIIIWGIFCRLSLKDWSGFIAKCRLLNSVGMIAVSGILLAWACCCCLPIASVLPCCSRVVMSENLVAFRM